MYGVFYDDDFKLSQLKYYKAFIKNTYYKVNELVSKDLQWNTQHHFFYYHTSRLKDLIIAAVSYSL